MPYAHESTGADAPTHRISLEPGPGVRPGLLSLSYGVPADAAEQLHASDAVRELERQVATLRQLLEAERLRSEELFELIPDPCIVTDESGVIRECNPAAAKLLGVQRGSLAGSSLASLMDAETRAEFRARIGGLRAGETTGWRGRLRSHEGEPAPVVISAAPMRDGERLAGLRWMLHDDSEHEAARARLFALSEELASRRDGGNGNPSVPPTSVARANGERRRSSDLMPSVIDLLGVMSHEVRTPVAAAHGYIEMLRRGMHGELTPAQRNDVESIAACHEHLLRVLDNALAAARLDNGHLDLALAQVPVDSALHGMHTYIQPELVARRVRYAYRGGDPATLVLADRSKLHQIMLNLLGNAVKFTPTGGSVTLSWQATETEVAISVADTGVGIAAAHLERVFEPYVRVPTAGCDGRGTGLGLAISRKLARAMGGEVRVASGEGLGSTFTLTLPRAGRTPRE